MLLFMYLSERSIQLYKYTEKGQVIGIVLSIAIDSDGNFYIGAWTAERLMIMGLSFQIWNRYIPSKTQMTSFVLQISMLVLFTSIPTVVDSLKHSSP